jgi:hypothetical protein
MAQTKLKPKRKTYLDNIYAEAPWLKSIIIFLSKLKYKKSFRFFTLWAMAYMVLMSQFFGNLTTKANYLEIFPQELILPSLMHALTALITAAAIYWLPWLKSFASKMLVAVIFAFLMIGYDDKLQVVAGIVGTFIPGFTMTDPLAFVSLVYLPILFAFAVTIAIGVNNLMRKIKGLHARDLALGIGVLVGYIFVLPAFSMMQILPILIQESSVKAPEIVRQSSNSKITEKPDIFYIVLDRYASDATLKSQFSFDNSPFIDFLKSNNFKVNNNAHSNYPYTASSVASTMNANYTVNEAAPFKDNHVQSATLYHNLTRQSSVVRALKSEGYTYEAVGSTYGASNMAPLADHDYMWDHEITVFGKTLKLRDIEASEFLKSPYYRFTQMPFRWWPIKSADRGPVDYLRAQINTLNDITTKDKPGGRFVFVHMIIPHEPFYFNSDGSLSTTSVADDTGRPIKEKYLGQVQFISNQMKQIVSNIQKQSGGRAVIIFNADEGPYPQVINSTFSNPTGYNDPDVEFLSTQGNMEPWSKDWLEMKFGILQAVHIPKATKDDLDHISSVNIFRIVLNSYFGYNLSYLPDCQMGVIHGKWYALNFADLTSKFSSQPDPACKKYETLPNHN